MRLVAVTAVSQLKLDAHYYRTLLSAVVEHCYKHSGTTTRKPRFWNNLLFNCKVLLYDYLRNVRFLPY
jgi:hypothetical protein